MSISRAAFAIFVLIGIWSLYRLQKNPDVDFNLLDLLMENGKVSKVSCLVMGAFIVTSWLMIDLQAHSHLTEGYFGLYAGAWVAPLIARLMNPTSTTTTTTSSSATVSTQVAPDTGQAPEKQTQPANIHRPGRDVKRCKKK